MVVWKMFTSISLCSCRYLAIFQKWLITLQK